jgi:hypothetical protein
MFNMDVIFMPCFEPRIPVIFISFPYNAQAAINECELVDYKVSNAMWKFLIALGPQTSIWLSKFGSFDLVGLPLALCVSKSF